jgi:hypothetical protein
MTFQSAELISYFRGLDSQPVRPFTASATSGHIRQGRSLERPIPLVFEHLRLIPEDLGLLCERVPLRCRSSNI